MNTQSARLPTGPPVVISGVAYPTMRFAELNRQRRQIVGDFRSVRGF